MSIIDFQLDDDRTKYGQANYSWTGLTTNDTGKPLEIGRLTDRTIQVFGDFGSGATVTIQGSNDPRVITDAGNAVWFTLNDPFENACTFTAAGGKAILEAPRFIRPSVTLGTSPDLDIHLSAKRS